MSNKSPSLQRLGSLPMPGMTAAGGTTPTTAVRQLAMQAAGGAACAEFQAAPAWRKKGDACARCGQPSGDHTGAKPKSASEKKDKKVDKEKKAEKDKKGDKDAAAKDKPKESVLSKLPATKVQPADLSAVALKPISARAALPPPGRTTSSTSLAAAAALALSSPATSGGSAGTASASGPGFGSSPALSVGSPSVPTKARTNTEPSGMGSAPGTPLSPRMRGNSNPFAANASPPPSPRSNSFSAPHASFYGSPVNSGALAATPVVTSSPGVLPAPSSSSPSSSSSTSSSSTSNREQPAVSLASSISSSLSTNDVVIHDKLIGSGGPASPMKTGIAPVQPGKLSAFISSQATAELSKGQAKISKTEGTPQPARRSVLSQQKTKTLPSLDQTMLQSQINDPYGMGVSTYFRTMSNLLHALELKDDAIQQVEDLVAKSRYIPSLEEKKLMQPIPLHAQQRLEKVVEDLTEFIKVQHRLRQIIKIQAVTRGFLARKQFKQYSELYIRGPLKARNEAFKELLKRERVYVANLQLIVKEYMKPLKDNTKGYRALCTDKEVSSIFGNIEALLTVHREMLHQLEIIQSRCPHYDGLGEVFLTMAPFFKAYGEYVNNFQNGVNTLLECKEKDRFASFIDEIYVDLQKRNVYVDLHGLLSTPLNHIAGYETLIMALVDSTPVGHRDHRSLSHCFSIISGTSRYIRDCIASADNIRNMQTIQDKLLKEKDKPALLIASDHQRRFVKEGPCLIVSQPAEKEKKKKDKERKGYLFAFNDILLVTRPAKGGYKVIDRLDMDQAKLEELPDTGDSFPLGLVQNNRKYVFAIPTLIEKVVWVTELKRTIGYYEKTKIFGAPLARLCDTKSGVPAIVERLAAHLEAAKAYEIVGIFRISGNISNINFLRDTIDRAGIGKEGDVNLAMSNVHDVSSVFKLFFREMPEPLLTYGLYDPVLRLMSTHNADNMDKTLQELAKLLKGLPRDNQQLLFWLLRYLNKYLQYAEQSKMTSSNISIVFSPNLCRPKQETIEYSLQLEKVNNAFELMITQHQQLAALVSGS